VDDNIKLAWEKMKRDLSDAALDQTAIATSAGVSQPAVSRILRKCPQRAGRAFVRLCIYASEFRAKKSSPALSSSTQKLILGAVRDVWNGTPEHARAIAAIIRAAGAVARASRR